MHHKAVEMEREVAGGARPRNFLHAEEYPVLDGLLPIGEGHPPHEPPLEKQ